MRFLKIIAIVTLVFIYQYPNESFANEEVKLIVKYKEGVKLTSKTSLETSMSLDIISIDSSQVKDTIQSMQLNPNIEYIEIDHKVYGQSTPTPNDAEYLNQKPMFDAIRAQEAWEKYTPIGEVIVAVIDSGVDQTHHDLESNLVPGKNMLNSNELPIDEDGHGTHVTGLIGAVTNNLEGVASLSQGVKLMPIKVLQNNQGYISDVILGIEYAVLHGADIINLSLGSNVNSYSLKQAIDFAVANNVLVVAAAGNGNDNKVIYPAAYESVLSVGSIDLVTKEKASFSNYGLYIDVVAPGVDLLSTWKGNEFKSLEGTSMSAAIVSSLAALLMKDSPYLSGQQVKKIIENSANAVGGDYELGNGLIDARQALDKLETNNRLYGATSVETAIEISQYGWSNLTNKTININDEDVTGSFVVIATGNKFPDSLAAAPLASYLDSPILLVKKPSLSENIKDELQRLNPSDVIIIGGENAVSKEVETELSILGYKSHRVYGADRYKTSIAVNLAIPYETNKAFVVSGESFPDALSVAAYSGINKYPILYTRQNTIPKVVSDYINREGITKTYVIGGEIPISSLVEQRLPAPYRIAGTDRYETNYKVHKNFGNYTADTLYFSTGATFTDALAVAPLAARTTSPVILTQDNQENTITNSINLFGSNKYQVIGGTNAISIDLAWKIDYFVNN